MSVVATDGATVPSSPAPTGAPTSVVKKKRPASKSLGRFLTNIALLLVVLLWLVPTLGLFITSLRPISESSTSGWWTIFTDSAGLTLENYAKLLGDSAITGSLWNSIAITVPTTVLVVIIGALAAYAFAWLDFPGRNTWFLIVIVLLAVPLQIAFIPLARLFGGLGIFGSTLAVVLFHVAFGLPFAVFLLRNSFAQVPFEVIESAQLDGANVWTIFTKFMLPLAKPAIASLAIYQFLWTWNDMLVALIFTDSTSQPITVAIQSQLRAFSSNMDLLAAGAFLSMIVPLIIYFLFQRYFETAIMAGSSK